MKKVYVKPMTEAVASHCNEQLMAHSLDHADAKKWLFDFDDEVYNNARENNSVLWEEPLDDRLEDSL